MSVDPKILIKLSGLGKVYGSRLIFKNINLELAAGQILLLGGANGCGKSTLLRLMAGLARPSAGRAELRLPPGQVGYLAHQSFIYPQLSLRENLLFWGRLYGASSDKSGLDQVLEQTGLIRLARERAGILSRGQIQRLSLARLLLQRPALLLLDEPESGLDPKGRAMLQAAANAAAERGAALVWVSHSLNENPIGQAFSPRPCLRAELLPGRGLVFMPETDTPC